MYFIFADDSRRNQPTRPGMGPLIAIGGICVPESNIKNLNDGIEIICSKYGFPQKEEFKWSPGRSLWMRDNLVFDRRRDFFIEILTLAASVNIQAIVVVEDTSKRPATPAAPSAEIDAVRLFFERIDSELSRLKDTGIIIVDRPGGDRANEDRFLFSCLETLQEGTPYVTLKNIIMNVLSTPSKFSRFLQLADLVTSCTLAIVSGENQYSPPIFQNIKTLMCRDGDRIGGRGLKIHPDFSYVNLYHWLIQDPYFRKGNAGVPLPIESRPYCDSPYEP